MTFLAIIFIYFVGQTQSLKIFKQEAMYVATFDQLGKDKFCPEIIDVVTMSKETNKLWI